MPGAKPTEIPTFPAWVRARRADRNLARIEQQVGFAIELAAGNVLHRSAGPFGAAVFDSAGGLVAAGVNPVQALRLLLAHAEIIALVAAQRTPGRPRLDADGSCYTLATSAQPCCQCHGAIVWAGISALLIGARGGYAIAGRIRRGTLAGRLGGRTRAAWVRVRVDNRRADARAVLAAYRRRGGVPY